MAEIKEIIRCYNCGTILQSEDPSKPGYINKDILESERQSFFFCNDCFEKERHHQPTNEPKAPKGMTKLIEKAKEAGDLFIYVINSFSFESSFASQVSKALKGANIIVLANKIDLLPKNTDLDKFKKYIAHTFLLNGLKIKKDDILFSSMFDEETTKELLRKIYERCEGKNAYLIGAKLSGKRTLIDAILRNYSNQSKESIISKKFPETDLRVLRIPLSKNSSIYDVPSIDDNNSVLHEIERPIARKIDVNKPLKARKISLGPKHALFIGGLVLVEILNDVKTSLDIYVSPEIDLERTGKNNSDVKFIKAIEKHSVHPVLSWTRNIRDYDVFEVDIDENGLRDIGIQGLGWFTFKANSQAFRIFVPKGVALYTSSSKVLLDE